MIRDLKEITRWVDVNEASVWEMRDPSVAIYDPADHPRFELLEWEKHAGQVNCMAYALNAPGEVLNPGGVKPGSVSEIAEAFEKGASPAGSMLEAVQRGLEEDGLKPVEEDLYRRGHYLVALFMNSRRSDYHFMRLDSDGHWSQMNFGTTGVSRKQISGEPIVNPLTANLGPGISFAGFYHVPRGGVSALRGQPPEPPSRSISAPQPDNF